MPTSHGMGYSPTWRSWSAMKARCNDKDKKYWGGKGISYPNKWETFEGFLADMGERPAGTTLDREDPDKDYCKSNCRWATATVQARHARNEIEFEGEVRSIREWAVVTGIKERALWMRLHRSKWSVEKALTTPPRY